MRLSSIRRLVSGLSVHCGLASGCVPRLWYQLGYCFQPYCCLKYYLTKSRHRTNLPSIVSAFTMPAPPYEDLPQITLSINQFTETAQTLASSEDGSKFVPFVLAGRLLDDEDIFEDVEKRVFVNPIVDAECPPGRELKFSRDYDSVIGVSSDLPYLSPLAVFPVPPFKDTLKRTNHVNQRITRHDVSSCLSLSEIDLANLKFFRVLVVLSLFIKFPISRSERSATDTSPGSFSPRCIDHTIPIGLFPKKHSPSSMINVFARSFRR